MPRLGTAQYGIFSGLIKCKKCGNTMRIKNGRGYREGEKKEFYYVCHLKEISKKEKCDMKNIIGHRMEPEAIKTLGAYAKDKALQEQLAYKNEIIYTEEMIDKRDTLERLKKEQADKLAEIYNMVDQVAKTNDTSVGQYYGEKIKVVDDKINDIKQRIAILELELSDIRSKELDMLTLLKSFESIRNIEKINDTVTKRRIMKMFINKMEWDGKQIIFHFKTGESINFREAAERGDFYLKEMQTFRDYRQSDCAPRKNSPSPRWTPRKPRRTQPRRSASDDWFVFDYKTVQAGYA
jgi:site-specific DNA recombinase